jgi:hypothetical protein
MPGFMHAFIHDLKHGITAISNHSVPLLSMKEHISRPQSQKERWGVRRAHGSIGFCRTRGILLAMSRSPVDAFGLLIIYRGEAHHANFVNAAG